MKKASLLFFWIFISLIYTALADSVEKGVPFITNYITQKYNGHNQNWDIIEDYRGFIYFANGDGVLVYDGTSWELIELPNKISSRALGKNLNGIIYTGGTNELGYLQPDDFGKLHYVSLMDSLGIKEIGIIRSIKSVGNVLYFKSLEYIIRLDESGFKYWKAKSEFTINFIFNDKLFVIDETHGLYTIEEDSLFYYPNGDEFANTAFLVALQNDNEVFFSKPSIGFIQVYSL